jgi:CRP-like cAMP-binding protein
MSNTNLLLQRLPPVERKALRNLCEPVELAAEQVLQHSGEPIWQLLFPLRGCVALLTQLDKHTPLELGMVGREGCLGASALLGVAASPLQAQAQGQGLAWRLPLAQWPEALARCASLRPLLLRLIWVELHQWATASGCWRFHALAPRMARWLLMRQDRADSDSFPITHQQLADQLGVRRVGVTQAAGVMQRGGLISYHRGQLTVTDRVGLLGAACSCYRRDLSAYREGFRDSPKRSATTGPAA